MSSNPQTVRRLTVLVYRSTAYKRLAGRGDAPNDGSKPEAGMTTPGKISSARSLCKAVVPGYHQQSQ